MAEKSEKVSEKVLEAIVSGLKGGKTLDKAVTVDVADIVHHGQKLVLPEGLGLDGAITLIKRRQEYEKQETAMQSTFDVYPWDGAYMLDLILKEKFGWAQAIKIPGMFGDTPPTMVEINVGPHQTITVPWGRFSLPNVTGWIQTSGTVEAGRVKFVLQAKILRKDEKVVQGLFEDIRQKIATASIYRGKAVKVKFLDKDGDLDVGAMPTFLDTDAVSESMLVLSDRLERAVETNLFTPITRTADCMANGISVKRGVLLGGTYGTGKTLIAHVASKLAVKAGITFLYIQSAAELSYAIEFARQYQSPACVIFCEDIDREMDGERTTEMDAILNTIDGIDSKTSNIIVVLTTNNIQGIHPAMLRPGRLDAVIDVVPPDAKAIERLIKVYAGNALDPDADLGPVGEVLAGNIPAVIAEVVKRAKLAQLSLQARGTQVQQLSGEALLEAAETIQAQVALLNPAPKAPPSGLEGAFEKVIRDAFNGNAQRIERTDRNVRHIHDKVVQ